MLGEPSCPRCRRAAACPSPRVGRVGRRGLCPLRAAVTRLATFGKRWQAGQPLGTPGSQCWHGRGGSWLPQGLCGPGVAVGDSGVPRRDSLLLEAGFLAVLVAPLRLLKWRSTAWRAHDGVTFWLVRWLLFRLMFASGVVKLTSRCPTWWGLTGEGGRGVSRAWGERGHCPQPPAVPPVPCRQRQGSPGTSPVFGTALCPFCLLPVVSPRPSLHP